jgi:hypothetical protein
MALTVDTLLAAMRTVRALHLQLQGRLFRFCLPEEFLEKVEDFIRFVVLKPVTRALDPCQFGVLKMLHHAGRGRVGQKTFRCR